MWEKLELCKYSFWFPPSNENSTYKIVFIHVKKQQQQQQQNNKKQPERESINISPSNKKQTSFIQSTMNVPCIEREIKRMIHNF